MDGKGTIMYGGQMRGTTTTKKGPNAFLSFQ